MTATQPNHIIQPLKFANKNGEIKFNWLVKDFSELCEMLLSDSGEVKVTINGQVDQQKRCLLAAKISANVTLECQSSFEPMDFKVESEVTFCTVKNESQLSEVDESFEAVLCEDGLLDVKKLIEDELILSIPIAANKPVEELSIKMSYGKLDEEAIAKEELKRNPFSVLTDLKK